jgi:hypothetical protein
MICTPRGKVPSAFLRMVRTLRESSTIRTEKPGTISLPMGGKSPRTNQTAVLPAIVET